MTYIIHLSMLLLKLIHVGERVSGVNKGSHLSRVFRVWAYRYVEECIQVNQIVHTYGLIKRFVIVAASAMGQIWENFINILRPQQTPTS